MGAIRYKIIKEKALLLQQFTGNLTKQDLAEFFTELYNNPDYLLVSTIFSDFSKADVALTDEETEGVAKFIIAYAPKVRYVKNAIIVNEPLITAYILLYQEVMKAMPLYDCNVFSTFNEASKYIGYEVPALKKLISHSFSEK